MRRGINAVDTLHVQQKKLRVSSRKYLSNSVCQQRLLSKLGRSKACDLDKTLLSLVSQIEASTDLSLP